MIVIRIMNEFLHSPLWIYEDGIVTDDLDLISKDTIVENLCKQIETIFSGYYEFDSHGQTCWFNHEQEMADKKLMLSLISKLTSRLNEINDGSFIVEDLETERVRSL